MILLVFILGIAATDLCVKAFVSKKLAVGEKHECKCKRLSIWHIKNKGIAYNHLEGQRKEILLFTGADIAFFTGILNKECRTKGNTAIGFSIAMLLGGALGNFLERIKKGYVTDYIHIKGKKAPIFNIADVFIAGGAVLFCLSSLFQKEKL